MSNNDLWIEDEDPDKKLPEIAQELKAEDITNLDELGLLEFISFEHGAWAHGQCNTWGEENILGKYLGLDVINDQNSSLHSK